jgi:hypothetical protein
LEYDGKVEYQSGGIPDLGLGVDGAHGRRECRDERDESKEGGGKLHVWLRMKLEDEGRRQ